MTKSELILEIAERASILTKPQVEFVVNFAFQAIKDALAAGDKVEIRGFGSFHARKKRARIGRNPKTGARVEVPVTVFPAFRPSIEIKEYLIERGISGEKLERVWKGRHKGL